MRENPVPRPVERSDLRLRIGSMYFTARRYLRWYHPSTRYASQRVSEAEGHKSYSCVIASHQSLLVRPLRSVDLWIQENKINNVQLAVSRIDGIILRPGEIFSVWRLVGKPSKAKGYLPGMVLINGELRTGYGGGLCQLSNLIYWMTLHTGLTVTERYRHQYDVFPDANRTLPFGSGATIAYNYIDLQIRNDTPRTYYFKTLRYRHAPDRRMAYGLARAVPV